MSYEGEREDRERTMKETKSGQQIYLDINMLSFPVKIQISRKE